MRLQCYYISSFGEDIENWQNEKEQWEDKLNLPFSKNKPEVNKKTVKKHKISLILEDIELFHENNIIENATNVTTVDGSEYIILMSFDELNELIIELGEEIINKIDVE